MLKSQMQVIREYPDSGVLREDDRVVIWRSKAEDEEYIVKLWKSTSWGDLTKEASRILAFLERADALVEAPLPGIVKFKRVIWTGDAIVLVQESILGATLRDEMHSMEAFPTSDAAISFISSLVDIIGGLHDRSVAHGDLKPENILVLRSDDPIHPAMPVLIDVLDFSPIGDGDRISRAYTPPVGGRFERDRFAITKIAEDLLVSFDLGENARSDLATAINQCRVGPPANGTLLPLKEALEKTILPVADLAIDEVFTVSVLGAACGPLLSDEGIYLHNLQKRQLVPGEREQSVEILFTPSTGEDLFVACLWTYVEAAGDNPGFYTFAAITDDPPMEVVEAGHDRCPVPIREDDIDAWLDPNPNDLQSLYAILDRRERPFYEHHLAKPET